MAIEMSNIVKSAQKLKDPSQGYPPPSMPPPTNYPPPRNHFAPPPPPAAHYDMRERTNPNQVGPSGYDNPYNTDPYDRRPPPPRSSYNLY